MTLALRHVARKLCVPTVVCCVLAWSSLTALAGSIDALSNQSADYLRGYSRNPATYGADIVFYNPAGTAFLHEGLYLNLQLQSVFKDYVITYEGEDFASTVPTPILPTFHAVWRPEDLDLGVFVAFNVVAGGGSLQYDKGVPFLKPLVLTVDDADASKNEPTNAYFEGSSMYLAPTIGVSYKFFDMVSISAAFRPVFADKEFKGHATFGAVTPELDADKSATGFGAIFGLHIRPIEQIDIGLRYELQTALEFETESNLKAGCPAPVAAGDPPRDPCPGLLKTVGNDGKPNALWSYADGATERRPLPAVLGAGIAIHFIPELTLSTSFTYYFIKNADELEDVTGTQGYTRSYDDDYDDGFDLAVMVEGYVMPELLLSIGWNMSDLGGNKDTFSDFEYGLDSNSIGLGARWTVHERVDLVFAFSTTLYNEGENDTLHPLLHIIEPYYTGPNGTIDPNTLVPGETFNKMVFGLGVGVEWRPL